MAICYCEPCLKFTVIPFLNLRKNNRILFQAILIITLAQVLPITSTNSESLPTALDNPILCANCKDCMELPPTTSVKKIRDSTNKSFCFTKQWTNAGLMTIDRGAQPPMVENWSAFISERCPSKQYRRKRPEQWCFCGTNHCNDEVMSIQGETGKYFRAPVAL